MINMESDDKEVPSTNHLANSSEIDIINLAELNNSDASVILNDTSDNDYEQKFRTIFKNKAYLEHLQYLTTSNPPKQDVLDEINKFLKIETLSYNLVAKKSNIDTNDFVQINIEKAEKFPEWSRTLEKTYLDSNGIFRITKLENNLLREEKLSKSIDFSYNDFLDLNNSSTPNKLKFKKTSRKDLKLKKLSSNERQSNKSKIRKLDNITQTIDSGINTISQKDQPNLVVSNIRKALFRQNNRSQRLPNKNQEDHSNLKGISELPANNDKNMQLDKENLVGIQAPNTSSQSKLNKENSSQISHIKYDEDNKFSSTREAHQQLESSYISSGTLESSVLKDKIGNNNSGDGDYKLKQSKFSMEKKIPYIKLYRILDKETLSKNKSTDLENLTNFQSVIPSGNKEECSKDLKTKNSRASNSSKKTPSNSQSGRKDHIPKPTRGPKRSIEDSESLTSSYHLDLKHKGNEMLQSKNDTNISSNKKIINDNVESGEDNKLDLSKKRKSSRNSTKPDKQLEDQVVVKLVDCFQKSEASKNTHQNIVKKTRGRKRNIDENIDNSQQPNLNEKKIDQKSKVQKTEKHSTINNSSTSLNTKCSENVLNLRNRKVVTETKALDTSRKLTETRQVDSKKDNSNKKNGTKNNKTADKIKDTNLSSKNKQSNKNKRSVKPKNQKLGKPEVALPVSKSLSTSTSNTYINGKNESAKPSMSLRLTRNRISPQKQMANIRSTLTRPKYRKLFSLDTYLQSDECIKQLSSC